MTASVRKSLRVVVTVPGHLHRVAESRAAAIMTGRPGMNTIMGYRPGDAERERSLAGYFAGTRSMILAAHCGIVPERVDRERSLLSCQLYPAGPDSLKEYYGIAEPRRVSSAAPGIAVRVPW